MELLKNPVNFDVERYITVFRQNAPDAMMNEGARVVMSDSMITMMCNDKFFDKVGRAILRGEAKRLDLGNALFEYMIDEELYNGFKSMGILPIVLGNDNFNIYLK